MIAAARIAARAYGSFEIEVGLTRGETCYVTGNIGMRWRELELDRNVLLPTVLSGFFQG